MNQNHFHQKQASNFQDYRRAQDSPKDLLRKTLKNSDGLSSLLGLESVQQSPEHSNAFAHTLMQKKPVRSSQNTLLKRNEFSIEDQKSSSSSNPREPIPAERLTFSSNMKDAQIIGARQKHQEDNIFKPVMMVSSSE